MDTSPIQIETKAINLGYSRLFIDLDLFSTSEKITINIGISKTLTSINYNIRVYSSFGHENLLAHGTIKTEDSNLTWVIAKVSEHLVIHSEPETHVFTVRGEEITCFRFTELDTASQMYRVMESVGKLTFPRLRRFNASFHSDAPSSNTFSTSKYKII